MVAACPAVQPRAGWLIALGRLGGAGLDVFQNEPDAPRELWRTDNVVPQSHQASATLETRRAMADLVLANLAMPVPYP